jgi:hypothetical protein
MVFASVIITDFASKSSMPVINWFLKNAADNETVDTEMWNPMLKWQFFPYEKL